MIEIELAGPGKNALGSELMSSIKAQIDAAGGEPLLLRGAGDAFSAGLNLKEIAGLDPAGMQAFLRLLVDMSVALFEYPGPTVAWVNGHAIAGGCVLALCCDWRVGSANPRARIGLNEVALGLRFPPRLLRILQNQVRGLERVVLHAGLYAPERALAWGLLDEVSEDGEALARQRLKELGAHPAKGYADAKADLRGGVSEVDPADEAAFLAEVLPAWTSDELRSRIQAFLK